MNKVDVLIPTYNVENYIATTLDSIKNQTLQNINILICDDCSTDKTLEIIKSYKKKDSRIKIFCNSTNQGITFTRNKLFDLSSSEYLAICDADDVYAAKRLQVQVDYLAQYREIDAVSSYFNHGIDGSSIRKVPLENNLIKAYFHLKNVFPNPGALIRKNSLNQKNIKYTEEFKYASDFDFWSRFSEIGRLANVDECLFSYRIHSQQISEKKKFEQKKSHLEIVRQKLNTLNTLSCETSIDAIVWKQKIQSISRVQFVCREVSNIIKKLSSNCQHDSLVPYVYDINLRSFCKEYGHFGLKNYIRYRGINNLIKGNIDGQRLEFDC